jgi:hypothetical protein
MEAGLLEEIGWIFRNPCQLTTMNALIILEFAKQGTRNAATADKSSTVHATN